MHYLLLGPLTVIDDDHEVRCGPPMDRALLILLLLYRGSTIGLDQITLGAQPLKRRAQISAGPGPLLSPS